MLRRGRIEIWADILHAVERETSRGVTVRPTRVRAHANLPHARFVLHVDDLAERGLVHREPLGVTDEGREFLRRAQSLAGALDAPP